MSVSTADDKMSFVRTPGSQPIKVTARSMQVVYGTTRQAKHNKTYMVAVQAIHENNGSLPKNIVVVDTYGEVQDGRVSVRVVNLGTEDVWLEPKSRLGTAHSVDVVQQNDMPISCDVEVTATEIQVRVEQMKVETAQEELCTKLDVLPFKIDIDNVRLTEEHNVRLTEEQERQAAGLFSKYKD